MKKKLPLAFLFCFFFLKEKVSAQTIGCALFNSRYLMLNRPTPLEIAIREINCIKGIMPDDEPEDNYLLAALPASIGLFYTDNYYSFKTALSFSEHRFLSEKSKQALSWRPKPFYFEFRVQNVNQKGRLIAQENKIRGYPEPLQHGSIFCSQYSFVFCKIL